MPQLSNVNWNFYTMNSIMMLVIVTVLTSYAPFMSCSGNTMNFEVVYKSILKI